MLLGGCAGPHDRAIDKLVKLRDRLCECPSLSCAKATWADVETLNRSIEPELQKMTAEERTAFAETQRPLEKCAGRFSM